MKKTLGNLVLLILVFWLVLTTISCEGATYVGVSVGVAGPYYGYPYGRYGYPYTAGGVVVGRPHW